MSLVESSVEFENSMIGVEDVIHANVSSKSSDAPIPVPTPTPTDDDKSRLDRTLPPCFRFYFPVTSRNIVFQRLYTVLFNAWRQFRDGVLTYLIGITTFFYPILCPLLNFASMIFSICNTVVFNPCLQVIFRFLRLLGIYQAVEKRFFQVLNLIDIATDYILTSGMKAVTYVYTRWYHIKEDLIAVWNQMMVEGSTVLKTAVRMLKLVYDVIQQVIDKIVSAEVKSKVNYCLDLCLQAILFVYNWFSYFWVGFMNTVNIIITTWTEQQLVAYTPTKKQSDAPRVKGINIKGSSKKEPAAELVAAAGPSKPRKAREL